MLTKSTAIFYVILLPSLLFLLISQSEKYKSKIKTVFIHVSLLIPTYLIGFLLYNILRLGPQFHMLAIRNKDYIYPLSHVLTSPFDPLLPFLDRSLQYFWIMGPYVVVLMFLMGSYVGVKNFTKVTFVLLLWSLLPLFGVSEFQRVMTARYIYFTIPYFFILSSLIVFPFSPGKKWNKLQFVLGNGFLFLFFLVAMRQNIFLLTNPEKVNLPRSERSGYLEEWTSGYGLKEVSEYLIRNNVNREEIHVGTEGYFGSLPDGLQIYMQSYPEMKVYGTGLDFNEVPEELLSKFNEGKEVYFVANGDRLHFDYKDSEDLELVKEFPKALRPDGSFQALYFFKVK